MSSDSAAPDGTFRPEMEGRSEERTEAAPSREPPVAQTDGPPGAGRCNVLLLSFLSFCAIGFGVAMVTAGKRYRAEYAQAMEGWRVGSTRVVELTLVKDDKRNLACATDQTFGGLRCGYGRDMQPAGSVPPDSPENLQPYNTVENEVFLGAGLWASSDLKGPLPSERFTVTCDYHIVGVGRSVAIRFDAAAAFAPVGKTLTVGTLSNCILPR